MSVPTSAAAWQDDGSEDVPVAVGRWSLMLRGTELADVRYADRLVLRAVRFVVRDHDWATADDVVLTTTTAAGTVTIDAVAGYGDHEVLRYRLVVALDDAGDGREARLGVHATAHLSGPFRRNRIGLVVLHPPTLAGTALTVRQAGAGIAPTATAFPDVIAPHQPALDVAGYGWRTEGLACALDLHGEVFEMEDQRNWTDASYKTYSTPLAEPFPVALAARDTVEQSLELRVSEVAPSAVVSSASVAPAPVPTPDLRSAAGAEPSLQAVPVTGSQAGAVAHRPTLQVLASSAPRALLGDTPSPFGLPVLVEAELDGPQWRAALASAAREADGAGLDIRFVTDDAEAIAVAADVAAGLGPVVRVGAFTPDRHLTTPALQAALTDLARATGIEVVAGTRAHFTELNRSVAVLDDWDGPLTFSITPQMHDRSRQQVVESLGVQATVVRDALALASGRPLHVGPVTLRPRFNAVATSPRSAGATADIEAGYGPESVPNATDPRQHAPAVADWLAASIAALSVPGVASVTLFEVRGPRGLLLPSGEPSPAARVLLG
ncbi:hypothetical protein DEI92_15345 [Curtobacterium sp. MCBD17_034]|uniref:hypothetical protein n=1 Tax=unclassified Curtobacterium TaxID=257496 RepID=UPI000DA77E20|nr:MULTISPECIES: hypothetical protein [unclassified Curtobacterium]PZF56172.1 hypothetical protein DEI92_15345 [Curtobacterium sp. MCBD17_034]PZM32963.1 hypothetical protein DEI90_15245 [Curtobacterium sp. MCBD17_031]